MIIILDIYDYITTILLKLPYPQTLFSNPSYILYPLQPLYVHTGGHRFISQTQPVEPSNPNQSSSPLHRQVVRFSCIYKHSFTPVYTYTDVFLLHYLFLIFSFFFFLLTHIYTRIHTHTYTHTYRRIPSTQISGTVTRRSLVPTKRKVPDSSNNMLSYNGNNSNNTTNNNSNSGYNSSSNNRNSRNMYNIAPLVSVNGIAGLRALRVQDVRQYSRTFTKFTYGCARCD